MTNSEAATTIATELGQSTDHPGVNRLAAALASEPSAALTPEQRAGLMVTATRWAKGAPDALLTLEVELICAQKMREQLVSDQAFHMASLDRLEANLTKRLTKPLFRDDADATAGTLPLTSIGPSGIGGEYQTEVRP